MYCIILYTIMNNYYTKVHDNISYKVYHAYICSKLFMYL